MTAKNHRPAYRHHGTKRRGKKKNNSQMGLPIGFTLYYYPHSQRLTPTIHDPELQRAVSRGLARAQAILARRGSQTVIRCVLFAVPQGEGFWLGEENLKT